MLFLAALLWAAIGGTARAQESPVEPPLSLSAAVERALAVDPATAPLAARIEQLRRAARLAGALDPMRLRLSAVAGEADEEANQVVQPIALAGQPVLRRTAAQAELRAALAARDGRRLEIAHQVARTWLRLRAAEASVRLARQGLEAQSLILGLTRRRFDVGDVPRSEVLRAVREQAAAARSLVSAEAEEESVRSALALSLGTAAPAARIDPDADLSAPPVPLDVLVAEALARRPDLAVARAQVEARDSESRLARTQRSPELEVSLYQGKLTGSQLDRGARLSLQWPLIDWGRLRSDVAQADARVEEARVQAAALERAISMDVQEALTRWQRLDRESAALRAESDAATELAALTERGYDEGLVTLLDVLEARHALRDLRAQEAELTALRAQASFDLLRALGRLPTDPILPVDTSGGQP